MTGAVTASQTKRALSPPAIDRAPHPASQTRVVMLERMARAARQ